MADSAALLVDDILPHQPMRQWVLSVPFPLRFLFASNSRAMTGVLSIVYRAIATHLSQKAGLTKPATQTGAITLIQHFGSALLTDEHRAMAVRAFFRAFSSVRAFSAFSLPCFFVWFRELWESSIDDPHVL
jgi:hypothetical protein